jgi:hypothetical protein
MNKFFHYTEAIYIFHTTVPLCRQQKQQPMIHIVCMQKERKNTIAIDLSNLVFIG